GDDGYRMARQIARERSESFDCAATRVWTLIEAGKKAADLERVLPMFEGRLGGPWLAFASESDFLALAYYSSTLKMQAERKTYVVTVAFGKRRMKTSQGTDSARPAIIESTGSVLLPKTRLPDTVRDPVAEGLARLQRGFTELAMLTKADPASPRTDQNHARFKNVCEAALGEFS